MVIDLTIGAEAVSFSPKLDLYLSPMSRIEITIKLPKFTIPGQSISNWDLMERLKKGVAPIQAIKILETLTVKVSGFSDPVRVRAAEAKSDFPSRHDWDLFFMKNKLSENKPGERPDTIYLAKVPIKWFSEKGSELPSEEILKTAMESFGKVRRVDIPACDPLRKEMDPEISGIRTKGFVFGPELFFEAYVQYVEYSGFADAMDSLRNMKWTKRIDGKVFHANVKVDFDRTRHLSDASINRREAERERINAEKRRIIEEEKRRIAEKEAEAKRILEEKEMRREERERKRKEKYEAERLRKEAERLRREEEERRAKEAAEALRQALEARAAESKRFLERMFEHIQRKEDRRIEVQEARLRAERRAAELLDIPISDKEEHLRKMLLQQREIRIREKLKEKIRQARNQKEVQQNVPEDPKQDSGSEKRTDKCSSPELPAEQNHSKPHGTRRRSSESSGRVSVNVKKHRYRRKRKSKTDSEVESDEELKRRKRKSKEEVERRSNKEVGTVNHYRRRSSSDSTDSDTNSYRSHRRRRHHSHKKSKKRKRSK
ncbi:A-kinase anchoring protein 17A [Trichostrongylus colubriformis]|uniref:A-kinase anchoring protein 17A n=1 Tax=Trichostrongylus colubriformis TaxID=6319 RepID=A0AAN8FTM9_TRICO